MSGRKKLNGQGALAVLGNGWTTMQEPRAPFEGKDGPDVILDYGTEGGSIFDHVTRSASPIVDANAETT